MKKIQILFPDPEMQRLREAARREDRPISEIVRRATEEYLRKLPGDTEGERKEDLPVYDGGRTLILPEQFREGLGCLHCGYEQRYFPMESTPSTPETRATSPSSGGFRL